MSMRVRVRGLLVPARQAIAANPAKSSCRIILNTVRSCNQMLLQRRRNAAPAVEFPVVWAIMLSSVVGAVKLYGFGRAGFKAGACLRSCGVLAIRHGCLSTLDVGNRRNGRASLKC